MISTNCFIPGFSTMISNLIMSFSEGIKYNKLIYIKYYNIK